MAMETRHTEKNMLFALLQMKHGLVSQDYVIAQLMAQMEPEDVKLVQQSINELNEGGTNK